MTVARTPQSVYGGRAWATLTHTDEKVQCAFALWGNSTLGMICHWLFGLRTQNGRSIVRIGLIPDVVCPDFNALGPDVLDRCALHYKEICNSELRPCCQAHIDTIRMEIDRFVIEMLGAPPKTPFSDPILSDFA